MNSKRLLVLLLFALCPMVRSQGSGDGVSKYTRGHSDPRTCMRWFKRYLEGDDAPGECTAGICECATQGRVQVGEGRNAPSFGVHSINCSYHPYGEYSLKDVEDMMTAEVLLTFCAMFQSANSSVKSSFSQKFLSATSSGCHLYMLLES